MLIKINGRTKSVPEGFKFRKLKDGQFLVEWNHRRHYIIGGKSAGGSSREWFVDGFGGEKSIAATSLMDCINLIINA